MKGDALNNKQTPGLMLNDRRANKRMGFVGRIRWNTGGVDRIGRARDISEADAGFTVHSLSAPSKGDVISLIYELTPDHEWLVDNAAVVKRCDRTEDNLYDVGVQFSPLAID